MDCNFRPPDATPVLIRFNSDAHPKYDDAQPIRCRLIAFTADTLRYVVNIDPVTLTYDL